MLTSTFNQSYTVRLATSLPTLEHDDHGASWDVADLAKSLQALYDGSCAPAGSFDLELLGETLIVTLLRDIGEDLSASNRFADEGMTVVTVQDQLVAEYNEAMLNLPEGHLGQTYELGALIVMQLRKRLATVEGLPCQMTKVRLVCEWIMPAGTTMEQVRKALHDHKDMVDLVTIRGAEREKAEFYIELPGGPIGTYTMLDLVKP